MFPTRPQPVKLDAAQATALDLIAVGGASSVCFNHLDPQLKAVVTLADGKKLETWSARSGQHGKLGFDTFEFSSTLGAVDSAGRLVLPGDPFAVAEHDQLTVTARIAARPELESELPLRIRFDCGAVANASGAPGVSGFSGRPGTSGNSGRSGTSSQAATDAEPGGHGDNGSDGGSGAHGPEVEVALSYVDTPAHGELVLARVGRARYLFAAGDEGLVVSAAGGRGGSGGSGGQGGRGGDGGSHTLTEPAGDGGNGGDGGDGGNGGNGADGGDGGSIAIRYDARFPELAKLAVGITGGGSGGAAGFAGSPGSGGSGGSSSSGRAGSAGRPGKAGSSGREGRDGRPGAGVTFQAADVRELFRAEIDAGLPLRID